MKKITYIALVLVFIAGITASFGFKTASACDWYYDNGWYENCATTQTGGPIITNTNNNNNVTDNINTNVNTNNITITGIGATSGGGSTNYYPQCDDGYDNDGDGRIDYPEDSGCSSYSDDSERTSGGSSSYECNDGRDNDGDGDYDYPEDRGCSSYTDDSEDSEGHNNTYQCNDGRDNDGDGDYDYPEDLGCSSRTDNSENSEGNNNNRYECNDGRDNDGDGDYDYPEDLGCSSRTDNSEDSDNNNRYECNDGRDNDHDGDIDYPNDPGCRSRTDNSEDTDDNNNGRSQCNDGRDNDGDGDYDYPEDLGCSSRTDNSENSERNSNNGSAPYFTSTPVTTVVAGQIYSYNADAVSPNNRTITYSLAVSPSGMTINSFTGLIQWAVPATLGNSYQGALVVATDTSGNQGTQSYIISVQRRFVTPVTPVTPVNPVRPPVQELAITNLNVSEVGNNVIASFNTNIPATGSVRYGQASESNKTSNFTYPFSQVSENGQGTSHEVNLGPLAAGQVYFLRAFASSASDSAFSQEVTFTRSGSVAGAGTEAQGSDTCFDGVDNDQDSVADSVDQDCQTGGSGEETTPQIGGTFASALESFGAFLVSPWFLLLVIIILVIYIIITRHQHEEVITTNGPIEIKS